MEGKRFVDKRVVKWLEYYPNDELKGYVILHLDNDPFNFAKDNLVKVKKEIFLLMLNNHLYFSNKELNKSAIMVATNIYYSKKIKV